jgi:hypothetical protein
VSGPAETVALGLLDAGWSCIGVEMLPDGTATLTVRTPPIPVSTSPDFTRLLHLALGKESPP